jgi:hypothetical protein
LATTRWKKWIFLSLGRTPNITKKHPSLKSLNPKCNKKIALFNSSQTLELVNEILLSKMKCKN